MLAYKELRKEQLPDFVNGLIAKGKKVFAPVRKGSKIIFANVNSFSEIADDYIQTNMSAKEIVFPKVEVLFGYKKTENDIEVIDRPLEMDETVVYGLRPCDAAGFEYLRVFFLSQNTDVHVKQRFEKTSFVAVSCNKADSYCFCTSVELGPGSAKGADILLTDTGNGMVYTEVITERGQDLVNLSAGLFAEGKEMDKTPYLATLPLQFSLKEIRDKIAGAFDSPSWINESLGCVGCGACAYSCPTCTCFDIQDEGNIREGVRVRCWDSCGYGLFTLHASGHNPRHVQSERRRNRLMHKFKYSDENLGIISCVGCGRCIRVCPANLNIVENILNVTTA